ncbi:hypothetical protein [Nostoc linckia]|uniref:hypothetical protein n=1 Tax=Nostoc linckia TaxID=92942 RepID=UPI00117C41DB|nr:hypothetical protein [Nostoc linckia]
MAAFCPGAFKAKRDKALEYQCDYLLADMPLDILALQPSISARLLPTIGRHFVSIIYKRSLVDKNQRIHRA